MAHGSVLRRVWAGSLVFVTTSCLFSCGGSGGSRGPSLWERCEDRVACWIIQDGAGHRSEGGLYRKGQECRFVSLLETLTIDPATVVDEGETFSAETTNGSPMSCLILDVTPEPQNGKCHGNARSCSSVGWIDCYTQDGCHGEIGDTSTSSDDRCKGSATSCNEYDKESSCTHQQGCSWEE